LGKQVWGYCNGLEDEDYVIEISSNINTSDMVTTIFHELVHVKQIIDGRLDEDGRTWKGKTYDTTKTPYKELPWEIEAFRLQRLMTKEFFSA
jgi:predicted metallopeptidase